jgi:glutaryl-CoA dehydrogenase
MHARYGVACSALGSTIACYNAAKGFAGKREVFRKPIAAYQVVQELLANMLVEITKAQLLNYHLGRLLDAGEARHQQISMAKLNGVKEAMKIARLARPFRSARHPCRAPCDSPPL